MGRKDRMEPARRAQLSGMRRRALTLLALTLMAVVGVVPLSLRSRLPNRRNDLA